MATITIPRLCVVGFSIVQPFLIGKVVSILQQTDSLSQDMGYGLIGVTAVVFNGITLRATEKRINFTASIKKMAAGDKISVGSKGSKLSGGQRQRIAIARAVYTRKRIACFDDILSGLDNTTARHVFNNVFGPAGLLPRLGSTVFLATHTVHHLPQADLIIVLRKNGQVVKQGSYTEIVQIDQSEGSDKVAEPSDHITVSVSTPSTDAHRPTIDLAIYKYYFSTLGWFRISALLLFLVTKAGMSGFRYKLELCFQYAIDETECD
ncbi:hypothetical protein N7491_003047 [Penicillium cf. griseofulvum]|nr:hypothetical protein N7491_003047 [Penicillium cf. griseofulvum]